MKPIKFDDVKDKLQKAFEERKEAGNNTWNVLPDFSYFQVFNGTEEENSPSRLLAVVYASNPDTGEIRLYNLIDLVPELANAEKEETITEAEAVVEAE